MENITLGFAMCGSFCTFDPVLTALEALKAQYPDIIPILSPASASTVCGSREKSATTERGFLCGAS